jgi:hypothetical protein
MVTNGGMGGTKYLEFRCKTLMLLNEICDKASKNFSAIALTLIEFSGEVCLIALKSCYFWQADHDN